MSKFQFMKLKLGPIFKKTWLLVKKGWKTLVSLFGVISLCLTICLGFETLHMNKLSEKLNRQTYELNKSEKISKERSQANKVALWKLDGSTDLKELENKYADSHMLAVPFKIVNKSNLPVYDVVVISVVTDLNGVTVDKLIEGYGRDRPIDMPEEKHYTYSRILPPGSEEGIVHGWGSGMNKTDELVVFFKDVTGTVWYRSNNGYLEKIGSEEKMMSILNKLGILASDLSVFSNFKD